MRDRRVRKAPREKGSLDSRRGLPTGRSPASDDTTSVADIGEFALIERLAGVLGITPRKAAWPPSDGEIAIGDDAAAWLPTPGRWEVLTTDALVEGIHFRLSTTGWRDLGWKAMAENVSDVAAMGGRPRRAFVTLGVPGKSRVTNLEDLYLGMQELCSEYQLAIVGGDTVAAAMVFISISVVGEVDGPGLRRAAGQPGDLVAVTGTLGGSRGGLELLEGGLTDTDDPDEQQLIARHRRPCPRVAEGLVLAHVGARCGMDLSDGLLGDAAKLARASGVGVALRRDLVPVDRALARRFRVRARDLALAGGEDYELLIAAPQPVVEHASAVLVDRGLSPLTIVGDLTAEPATGVRLLDCSGRPVEAEPISWDHFAPTEGR